MPREHLSREPNNACRPFPSEVTESLERAAAILKTASRVLLTTHVNPDGDAVGSVLALAHDLHARGIEIDVALADPPPRYCSALPGIEWIHRAPQEQPFQIAVVCDAAGIDRIGNLETVARAADQIIEIDHHAIARPFGTIRIVDDTSFATAELVYHLLQTMESNITPAIATCLMMGVATDTGAFRFTNTNGRTFALATQLMDLGADLAMIMDRVYDSKTVSSIRLLQRALGTLKCEHSFASATLSLDDFSASGAPQEESEGVVGHLRSLEEAQVAAVLREAAPDSIRVSLRGRPGVNVATIAERFGGGGHTAAAGCTINLPLADAELKLRAVVESALSSSKSALDGNGSGGSHAANSAAKPHRAQDTTCGG